MSECDGLHAHSEGESECDDECEDERDSGGVGVYDDEECSEDCDDVCDDVGEGVNDDCVATTSTGDEMMMMSVSVCHCHRDVYVSRRCRHDCDGQCLCSDVHHCSSPLRGDDDDDDEVVGVVFVYE